MKKYLILFIILLTSNVKASHIVGGEITYKYVSVSGGYVNYTVTLTNYIDCDNGDKKAIESDLKSFINIYSYNNLANTYTYFDGAALLDARTGPSTVSQVYYKCIKDFPKICVDQYTFIVNIRVPINSGGYVLSFERCCRNKTINNIYQPSSTGATFWTHIPGVNTISKNSSPTFKALPANLLCLNAPANIDNSAIDEDGDSLVYELYTPFTSSMNSNSGKFNSTNPSNYQVITWEQNYSLNNQISGQPSLAINRKTGKLILTPTLKGQFVVGIKVLEFRNGVLIGETKRDYQFNVADCVFDVVSSFGVPYTNCSGQNVVFQNRSQGSNYFHWDFGVDSESNDTSNVANPVYVYKNQGYYTVRLISKAATDLCIDTSEFELYVKPNFTIGLGHDTLYCGPFTRILNPAAPGKTYQWNTGEKTEKININKSGNYVVTVSDMPCVNKDTINIQNDLDKLDLGPDSVICRDSFVQFIYDGKKGYKSYLWNDGSTAQSVFIPRLDMYYVNVFDINNCPSSDSITFILYPPPRVNLRDTNFCRGTTVVLDGVNYNFITKLETNYYWNTEEKTPQIVANTSGLYIVKVQNRLCTIIDSAQIDYIVTGLDLGLDTFYCGPVKRLLKPLPSYMDYLWNDGSKLPYLNATSPGKKIVTITSVEGCIESDSVMLTEYPDIDAGLGNDTAICLSAALELIAADHMVAYLWNTGAITQRILVKDGGEYMVTVKNKDNCIVSDTMIIKENGDALPLEMYMPNAFSPNEDGINETYPGNSYKDPGSSYELIIYNRWGEKLFASYKPEIQWNGLYKGQIVPQDEYIYYVKYLACDEKEHWFRGTFTLIK